MGWAGEERLPATMLHLTADSSSRHHSDGGGSTRSDSSRGGGSGRGRLPAEEAVGPRPAHTAPAVARKDTPSLQVRTQLTWERECARLYVCVGGGVGWWGVMLGRLG